MKHLPTPHTITDVLSMVHEPVVQIWGCISKKTVTLLYGSTGVGKSLFTLGLGIAIASKEKFCGIETKTDCRMIFLDAEMDKQTWAKRTRVLRSEEELHVKCDSINFLTRDDFGTGLVPNISLPSEQEGYTKIFQPFDLVIIDNLNTASYPKNERDGEIQQFLRVLPWLLQLRDSGKAVILVHHTNKEGKQMGSILKEQIADNVIQLQKLSSHNGNLRFKVQYEKHRHLAKRDAKDVEIEMIEAPDGVTWMVEDPQEIGAEKIREFKRNGGSLFQAAQKFSPELAMSVYTNGGDDEF